MDVKGAFGTMPLITQGMDAGFPGSASVLPGGFLGRHGLVRSQFVVSS